MGQYDFTYEMPKDFKNRLFQLLRQNNGVDVAQAFQRCTYEYEEKGYAHYAGLSGDTWNKKAIDFTIEGSEQDINILKSREKLLKEMIGKSLRPSTSGYLVDDINYIVTEDMEIFLPEEQGETFEILSCDIHDALSKGEPTLVLDRLHTYTTKYLREICSNHGISIADDTGKNYPLHSLAGALSKYYSKNNIVQSEFVEQTIKMSSSLFEKYNTIRNLQSYAHDNEVLNKAEAIYVVTVITATLTLIHEIESQ